MNMIEKLSDWQKNNKWKYIQIKRMIIIQFAFSVIIYILLITNQLTNHYDGLWSGSIGLSGPWELSIGRWFWLYIDRLRMGISSEPLTSCLTLFLIIIGNILICDIFGQVGKKTGYLVGTIILSSTTICNYLSYRYMSPTFGVSFLLSILAAWLLTKKYKERSGAVVASIITALGLGAYQANLACTCVILIIVFIKMMVNGEDNKKILNYIFKSIFSLAIGCIIYKLIWSFHLMVLNIAPNSYNGADNISIKAMIMYFPQNIVKTYKIFINYFFTNSIKHNIFQKIGLYYIVFIVIIITLFRKIIIVLRENYIRALLILIAFATLPMASNISLFLATEVSSVMIQMTAGMAILFPLILCLLNSTKQTELRIEKYKFILKVCTIFYVIILYGNIYMIAVDQETMYEGKSSSETIVHEMISELRERQMLNVDKTYLFVGYPSRNPLFKTTRFWNMANSYAKFGEFWDDPKCLRLAYDGMLRNIGINLTYATDDVAAVLKEREDVKNMDIFPAEESVREIDGYIIVKVS